MNVQPIGYRYPKNYININIASPSMDVTQCKKHTVYECDGTFYMKKPDGCNFVSTGGSPTLITSPYRRRFGSPYRRRHSPYRPGSPYRRPIGSPLRPGSPRRPIGSPLRPVGSPFKRR
jgi:hypothetical protein